MEIGCYCAQKVLHSVRNMQFHCCRFAQGSNGIYFGGKGFVLSELSGSFSMSADTVASKHKGEDGQDIARLSLRVGCPPSMASAPNK